MASIDLDMNVPSAEELKNSSGGDFDRSPLEDGVYICRVQKVELRKVPTYANNKPDYSKMKLEWQAILSPVKQLSGDPLQTVNKKQAEPLGALVWKKANPFSMGMQPSGAPSNTRALFAYGMGVPVDGEFKVSKIVVLNPTEDIATDEETKAYAEEYVKLRKNEITPDQAKMRTAGFKHVADLGVIEGKYLVASLSVDGDYNKVTSLSKLPTSFDPTKADTALAEGIKKFHEVIYPKMVEKRKTKATATSAGAETIDSSFDTGSQEIDLSDLPF